MMTPNPYRGPRNAKVEKRWDVPLQQGKMSDGRQAWVTLPEFDAIIFIEPEDKVIEKGYQVDTPPVRIQFRIPGRRYNFTISLTKMTAPELLEFQKCIQFAIDKALPICEKLDERAQQAYEEGDDSYARLYRPVPQFFDRERLVEQHGKGVQERSARLVDGVPGQGPGGVRGPDDGDEGGDGPDVHPPGGRDLSGPMADDRPQDLGTEHNEPEAGSTP